MSTAHDELYQRTAATVLNSQHGAPAILTPDQGVATPVTVRINRAGLEANMDPEGMSHAQGGASRRAVLIVTIARSDLPTLTLGRDTIAFAERRGGTVKTFTLEELINDAGDEWVVYVN